MKQKNTALLTTLAIALCIFSCRKDNTPVNTNDVRLIKIQNNLNNGDVNNTSFAYDASGRIISVTSGLNNQPPFTIMTITYSGTEAVIVLPVPGGPSATITDTIRLELGANNRITRRIQKEIQEFHAPINNPQRTFIYDTITYEYDGAGIVVKETRGNWDSTWFNPGTVSTSTVRTTGVTNHTISGGNVVSTTSVTNMAFATYQSAGSHFSSRSTETSLVFHYNKAYPNRTDFTNAAILNEINFISGSRINKAYTNLPEKYTGTVVEKDQAGNVTSTNTFTVNAELTYNSYGFLSTTNDPATPSLKTTFIYNK